MPAPRLPAAGGCRCGSVRFELTAPPLVTMACHCTGCQRMSSSAFSLSAAIPAAGLRIVAGEPVIGGLKGHPAHHFCPDCMSWMFTRFEAGGMEIVNLRPTMLDDPSWFAPFVETWTSERLPWAQTPAVHSYEGFPPEEDFPRLLAEYAEWAGPAAAP
ncbi:GFA family protein [Amaricoccus sp.]|uniref:GFA family protein n=1 Tax=Amaricoccus sp. TaxID=1872485 RepID=UPI001B6C068C|nr:GFA family protein [Amaricoccus sp.]MBP7241883.1 GFA family protein [Amaricoccus sp.]